MKVEKRKKKQSIYLFHIATLKIWQTMILNRQNRMGKTIRSYVIYVMLHLTTKTVNYVIFKMAAKYFIVQNAMGNSNQNEIWKNTLLLLTMEKINTSIKNVRVVII